MTTGDDHDRTGAIDGGSIYRSRIDMRPNYAMESDTKFP